MTGDGSSVIFFVVDEMTKEPSLVILLLMRWQKNRPLSSCQLWKADRRNVPVSYLPSPRGKVARRSR